MNLNDLEIDGLARVLHAAKFRSRRTGKHVVRELGGQGNAAELDRVMDWIRRHPQRRAIEDRAEELEVAARERVRRRELAQADPKGDVPEWLVGETPEWGRTFVVHFCPRGAWSFLGEVFDDRNEAPPGHEVHPLDEGQVLSNITWIDGERPEGQDLHLLMRAARRELRIYDSAGGDEETG